MTDTARGEGPECHTDTQHVIPDIGLPRPKNLTITVAPRSRLITLQEWEGLVENVDQERGSFTARLYDLRRKDSKDVEIAEFDINDVEPDGQELILPGAVFRWIIGYRDAVYGKRERVSSLVFRRLPAWTTEDLKRSEERGKSLANALRWK
jgi:hypothetical protein